MSKEQLLMILYIAVAIILLTSLIKLRYWYIAKTNGANPKNFLGYFFKWHSVYALWDTANDARRAFLKVNNTTNIIIWICTAIAMIVMYSMQ